MPEEDPKEPQDVEQDPPEPEPKPDDRTARSEDDPVDWVSEAKKWEKRAKANAEAAERLKELEDEKKTEAEKLQERIAELEPSAHEAKKLRVALRKGLTETQAKRLVGDTVEDLEADADDLIESFKSEGKPSASPRENLRAGAAPDTEPERSPEELAEAVMKRQRGF